jgi:WD40 repeat protein
MVLGWICLAGCGTEALWAATAPRSYASSTSNPTGSPDTVATMIMRKPIFPIAVHAVAFSPDGATVAAGDGTGRLRLWEAATGRLQQEKVIHSNWVFSVCWTRDGKSLVTGGGDNLIRWFDGANLERPGKTNLLHTNDVHAVALSADAQTLYSTGDDRQIVIWDVPGNRARHRFVAHERQVPALVLSSNGLLMASASRDRSVRLWDTRTATLQDTLLGHSADVVALSFSPDGRRLASAGWDYTVRLWDVESGKALRVILGHPNWVSGVAFSPNGQRLATSSGGLLRLLDAGTGEEVWSIEFKGAIKTDGTGETAEDLSSIAFSPDGSLLAVGSTNGSVYLVSTSRGEVVRQL